MGPVILFPRQDTGPHFSPGRAQYSLFPRGLEAGAITCRRKAVFYRYQQRPGENCGLGSAPDMPCLVRIPSAGGVLSGKLAELRSYTSVWRLMRPAKRLP